MQGPSHNAKYSPTNTEEVTSGAILGSSSADLPRDLSTGVAQHNAVFGGLLYPMGNEASCGLDPSHLPLSRGLGGLRSHPETTGRAFDQYQCRLERILVAHPNGKGRAERK